jgi:D-alanine--poly(phosphoribitol) ligase subunit 1
LFVEGELAAPSVFLDYLKSKMPFYMIPTKVLIEKEFPLNTNGKVDRNKLNQKIK